MITPVAYRPIVPDEIDSDKDPTLSELNNKYRELVDAVNSLMGVHGPISVLNDLDMGNNRIRNVGTPQVSTDAISQSSADPRYGAAVQQSTMEAVGKNMIQTARRLNDATQQHVTSGDLKSQGSIPPTNVGTMTYTATNSTITWSWLNLQIQYADGTTISVPDGTLSATGLLPSTAYYFYPYYDTTLGVVQFVADSINAAGSPPIAFPQTNGQAAIAQHSDGHVPLSNGGMLAQTVGTGGHQGGGGGGGGGGNCAYGGMFVMSRTRNMIPIRDVAIGDEIRGRHNEWTIVKEKKTGSARDWIKITLSNVESLIVTPSDIISVFDGPSKRASELGLECLLCGISEMGEEIPLQITRLEPMTFTGDWVLLTCTPEHEFLLGSVIPRVIVHNFIIKP